MAIVFVVRNRLVENYSPRAAPQFVPVKKTGTRYDLGGETVELFRIKVLAEALDRTVLVVKQWEREGRIPKPLYQVEGDQCTHWYSAAQIINCHRLMMGKYKGKKYLPQEELSRFCDEIKKVWHAKTLVVDENGEMAA